MKKYLPYCFLLVVTALVLNACNPRTTSGPPTVPAAGHDSTPAVLPQSLTTGAMMVWVDNSMLVFVPGGDFMMGADGQDNSQHTVTLSPFWIQRTKVSNRMYALCVAAGKCSPPKETKSAERFVDPLYVEHPVVGVNWEQASQYCTWVEGHLPTEAQWEKTSRGPDGNTYPWGNDAPTCDLLNFNNCIGDTSNIHSNSTGKSFYEALDMSGNVFEWVQDWYLATYYKESPSADPPGPASGQARVIRSSAYSSFESDVFLAKRLSAKPAAARSDLGFRCVVEKPSYHPRYCQASPRSFPAGNTSGNISNGCAPAKFTVGGAYCTGINSYVNVLADKNVKITGSGVNCQFLSSGIYVCAGPMSTTVEISVCGCDSTSGAVSPSSTAIKESFESCVGRGPLFAYDEATGICSPIDWNPAVGQPPISPASTSSSLSGASPGCTGFGEVYDKPSGTCLSNNPASPGSTPICPMGQVYNQSDKKCYYIPSSSGASSPSDPYPSCPIGQLYDPVMKTCWSYPASTPNGSTSAATASAGTPPPVSACLGGFTYDQAAGCCKADAGSQYPACGPGQVYDPLRGCLSPGSSASCQTVKLNFPDCNPKPGGAGEGVTATPCTDPHFCP